jgi:hypothetical protein
LVSSVCLVTLRLERIMQQSTNKLTSDLLRQLKSYAEPSQLVVKQVLSEALLNLKNIDLKTEVKKAIHSSIALELVKKANIIKGPVSFNNYGVEYKAVAWCFTTEELEQFISDVYTAGINASKIQE